MRATFSECSPSTLITTTIGGPIRVWTSSARQERHGTQGKAMSIDEMCSVASFTITTAVQHDAGISAHYGLVEAMDGRIWAESEVGKGSTFSFTLPKAG